MKRLPIFATIFVILACAIMVALGIWQLRRADEKEALLALFERNRAMSSEIALPMTAPVPDAALFRHASALCVEVTDWRAVAGRTIDGQSGWRYLASCRRGAEGPGFVADMGVANAPNVKLRWKGGPVNGQVALEPVGTSLFGKIVGHTMVPRPMLVAATPAPGLAASAPASLDEIPNNHLAYAVQWFVFAAIAASIYLLAVFRRKP